MRRQRRVHLVNLLHKYYIKNMPKFLAGLALALALSFAPIAQAHSYQHSITILSEDEEVLDFIKHEGVKLRSAKAKQEFFDGIKF